MVGDINLFLTPCTDDDDCEGAEKVHESSTAGCDHSVVGEIDVMIATISDRGKGLGRAAVTALLLYLARNLDAILACYVSGLADGRPARLQRLVAKIHASNTASRALFASLGFEKKGEPNYFGEVEMVLTGFPAAVTRAAWYKEAEEGYSEVRYFRPDLDPVKDDKSSIL